MTKSMTGYGKAEGILSGRKMTVEMKSVNHRFLEISLRLPQMLLPLKIDIVVRANGDGNPADEERFMLNIPLIRNYYALLSQLKGELHITEDISLATLTGLRDIFVPVEIEQQPAELWEGFSGILDEAVKGFSAMRETEGECLTRDLRDRLDAISGFLDKIDSRAPAVVVEYQKRLTERIRELAAGIALDESRLLQEVAIMAERSDITEEIVRLRSHVEQFSDMLADENAAGRKIDFLLQEMGREINTIGSKSGDIEISRFVVEVKSELAKLREQVQNIE